MANWFSDPTQVPTPEKKKYGKWNYTYSRKTSGPLTANPRSATIDYGPQEGQWVAKRDWEGAKPPGFNPLANTTATLPASWDPNANQFPWMGRTETTSDPQRQAAFQLGLGGGRTSSLVKKGFGTYFNPLTGFDRPAAKGAAGVTSKASTKAKYNPSLNLGFQQTPALGYNNPWESINMLLNRNNNMANFRLRGY